MNARRRGGRDSGMAGEHCQAAFSFTCAYLGLEKFPFLWQRERNIREMFQIRTSTLCGEGRASSLHKEKAQTHANLTSSLLQKGQFLERGAWMLELGRQRALVALLELRDSDLQRGFCSAGQTLQAFVQRQQITVSSVCCHTEPLSVSHSWERNQYYQVSTAMAVGQLCCFSDTL